MVSDHQDLSNFKINFAQSLLGVFDLQRSVKISEEKIQSDEIYKSLCKYVIWCNVNMV